MFSEFFYFHSQDLPTEINVWCKLILRAMPNYLIVIRVLYTIHIGDSQIPLTFSNSPLQNKY